MKREIALDTETTGLEPGEGHRIVEIGCVEMIDSIRTGKHFHCYLNPDRPMPAEAEAIHGISDAMLADKPRFKEKAAEFIEFIGESQLVIHNATFDMRFLNAELARAGAAPLSMGRATDTVMMARQLFPGQPASLDALCRRFEIDLTKRTKHGALLDAELLADVYLELNGGRQSNLILETLEETPLIVIGSEAVLSALPRRHFEASAEEKAAHRAFLSQVKDALWLTLEAASA